MRIRIRLEVCRESIQPRVGSVTGRMALDKLGFLSLPPPPEWVVYVMLSQEVLPTLIALAAIPGVSYRDPSVGMELDRTRRVDIVSISVEQTHTAMCASEPFGISPPAPRPTATPERRFTLRR